MTVPAFPTLIVAGPVSFFGEIIQLPKPSSMIEVPSALRPSTINWVSRESNGLRNVDGVSACAASMSARLVTDLDPGIVTVRSTALRPR